MAITDGAYPAEGDLILGPTNYTTGGTDLGLTGSAHAVGFNKDVSLLSKVLTGSQYTDARILGINLIYEITLLARSTEVMNLMFDGESASDIFEGYSTYLLGQLVGDSQTSKLLIRPNIAKDASNVNKPYLYMPRALVMDMGPVQFSHRGKMQEATKMTIVALWDTARTAAFHYGDNANLAAI